MKKPRIPNNLNFLDKWREFRYALANLTRLPIDLPENITPEETGKSLLWHTAVAFTVGGILVVIQMLLFAVNAGLTAFVVLVAWFILTGSKHFDGIADTLASLLPSRESAGAGINKASLPSKSVLITSSILIIFFAKFSALNVAFEQGYESAVIIACILARATTMWLIVSSSGPRPVEYGGLNEIADVEQSHVFLVIAVSCLFCVAIGGTWVIFVIAICAALAYVFQRILVRRESEASKNYASAATETMEAIALWIVAI